MGARSFARRPIGPQCASMERSLFLLALSDRLRSLSEPREIMRAAAEMIGRELSAATVRYSVIDADEDGAEIVAGWLDGRLSGAGEGHRYRLSQAAPGWLALLRSGKEVLSEDLERDPRHLFGGDLRTHGVRAAMAIPLVKKRRLVALVTVGNPEPRQWSEADRELLREVAERTWADAERARAEAALTESEQRYRTLFEAVDDACAFCELVRNAEGKAVDFRYLDVNGAFERLTRMSRADVIGRLRNEVFPPDTAAIASYSAAAQSGQAVRYEWFSAPTRRYYDVNVIPRGGDRFAVVFSDVTMRREAEAALRANDVRNTYMLQLSDALRAQASPDEILAAATWLLAEHLGSTRAFYSEIDEEAAAGRVARQYVRSGGSSVAGSYSIGDFAATIGILRHGEILVVDDFEVFERIPVEERARIAALGIRAAIAVPLFKGGKLAGSVCVSEQRRAREWTALDVALVRETAERTWATVERAGAEAAREQALAAARAAQQQAERANRAKDEFLTVLSHELRTPLAPILLWGRSLRAGQVPPEEMPRAFESIVASAESQSRLIEDLLDLSRITSGRFALVPQRTDIAAVSHAAVEIVRPAAKDKGHRIETAIEDAGRAWLDPRRFQQILWNLLSNAVKFTPGGGRISLAVRRDGRQLVAEVTDDGEGMTEEFRAQVFNPFRQANMGDDRVHGGLGIGLAVCRELVALQGGTIEAHSEGPGRGSTFRVRLPFTPAAPGPPLPQRTDAAALPGLRVLLVEDDTHTRDALAWTLQRAGAQVRAVATADDAVRAFAERRPDVMVCDVGLPGMDGYSLVRRVHEQFSPPIPACAVSAHARDIDRQRAIDAGFDLHVAKPVTAEQLVAAVHELAILAGCAP